jgi:hypothetical protein
MGDLACAEFRNDDVLSFGEKVDQVRRHHRAIGHCGCGAAFLSIRTHAAGLSREATLPEEITVTQNAYCGFLSALCYDGEFHFSSLYVKNRIGRIALNKDCLLFGDVGYCPAPVDGRKEGLEVELATLLGRCRDGCHG